MSASILIVHLLFTKFHTLFSKLLIFRNLGILCTDGIVIAIVLIHYWITVNSQTICHSTLLIYALTFAGTELVQ